MLHKLHRIIETQLNFWTWTERTEPRNNHSWPINSLKLKSSAWMDVSNFTLTSTFVASEVGAAADSGHGERIPDHVLGISSLLHLAAQARWIRHHHSPAACAIAASVGTRRVSALHCSIAGRQCTQATLRVHLRCKRQHQQHADAHGYKSLAALHGCLKLSDDTNS